MPSLQETRSQLEATYRKRTPQSAALFAEAQKSLPGGDTRTSTTFTPHPTYMARGEGPILTDIDGNTLIDGLNNYTSLIHGNAFKPVLDAAQSQLALGTAFGAPNAAQVRLAALICERVKSVERVRFTNSGTEGTMMAVRAARAFTGREMIVKVDGGYHGTHDSVSGGAGIPQALMGLTVSVPFNDVTAMERVLEANRGKIAAVIVEPVMGSAGFVPSERGYLPAVRRLTETHGALLILDEVMTFRLDYGGAQAVYGVEPDLTAFAKIIGGGFPVGAFGGRAEIMELFNPAHAKINHAGTFNGNPVTMAAGFAAMEHLTREKIAHANAMGDAVRRGFVEVLEEQGIRGQVTGYGSFVGFHLTAQPVRDYTGVASVRPILREMLHLGLLNRGVLTSRSGVLNVSTVYTDALVAQVVSAFQDSLVEMKPAIQSECPDLAR
ncbi:MAG: aspartate aminotransferase family protein [Chloroflexi bacterium]|nr:aspartate aminotransferase family protein [Chloroflexota bacterium]